MNQATELIAQQYANGAANKKVWSDMINNVKAYGAKGDGVTDDTAAIAAAIAAAAVNGGVVLFPPGTYINKATIVKPSNVMIRGSGRFITMIQHKGSGDCITMIATGPNYISHESIEDIWINSTGIGSVGVNMQYVQNFTMKNVSVFGFQKQGVLLNFGIMCTFISCSIGNNGAIGYAQVTIASGTTTTLFLNTYISGGINIGTGGTVAGLQCSSVAGLQFIGGAIENTGIMIQLLNDCTAMVFITDLEGPYVSYIEMGYGPLSTAVGNIANITIQQCNFQQGATATANINYGVKMKNCSQVSVLSNTMNIQISSLAANIWLEGTTNDAITVGPNTILGGPYILLNNAAPPSTPKTSQVWVMNGVVADKTSAFRAYQSANQSISAATFTQLQFQTEVYDRLSEYDTSTYRFNAKSGGIYLVSASVQWAPAPGLQQLVVYVNGALYAKLHGTTSNGGSEILGGTTLVDLSINDYIEIYCYSANAVTTTSGTSETYFSIARIA